MTLTADILSYAVFTGFQFAALCVMTRGGRGWPWRLVALVALVSTDVLVETCCCFAKLPLEQWLAVCFFVKWTLLCALIFVLSRDSVGRKLFLTITYGAYAIGFSGIFHVIAYRNVWGLPTWLSVAVGLIVVAVLNLILIFWILPLMPRDDRDSRWRTSCLAAFVAAASMYVCSFWPVSVINSPPRDCLAFWLMLVGVWIAFPLICRTMRERQHNAAVERSLELMTAEVRVRRAAIDEARRIRHDWRHHLIVIGNLLVNGQTKEALEYVSALDEGSDYGVAAHVWCENETVNAVLAGYARKAAEKGVDFTAEAHVERTAPLPDAELVAVVGNLIENAISACAHGVTVALRQRGDLFGLTVTNDVPPDFRLARTGLPCVEPGVGLDSVRHVVNRHSGEWVYTLADGRLTCELALCGRAVQ